MGRNGKDRTIRSELLARLLAQGDELLELQEKLVNKDGALQTDELMNAVQKYAAIVEQLHSRGKPGKHGTDYTGWQFGKLTAAEYAGKVKGQHLWRCICECGREAVVRQTNLLSGKTRSCGCLQAETYRKNMLLVEGTSVTRLEASDRRLLSNNSSGYNGVYYYRKTGKWAAQITFKGKTYHLGYYRDIADAVKRRKEAEEQIYGEFLKWYRETNKAK